MKLRFSLSMIGFLLLVLPVQAQEGRESQGATVEARGLLDLGVRSTSIDGSAERFNEYRDMGNGFVLEEFRLKQHKAESPEFFDIRIKDVLQEDEFYVISGGKHGRYRYNLFYDSIPHTYAPGRLMFNGIGSGYLQVLDPVQQGLENLEQTRAERASSNPLADTTLEDAATREIVRGLFAGSDAMTFKVVRKQTGLDFLFDIASDMQAWLNVKRERREGTKVLSTGTYERFAQSGVISGTTNTHSGDRFLISGAELAEPVEYLTTAFSAGAGIYRKTWLVDVEYTFTNFKNDLTALRWDNPFRISDASATNAAGAALDLSTNGFNRGRFAAGQLALAPDSRSHEIVVSAGVNVPKQGRLSTSVGYGLITQNETFLPYTLNSAVSGTGGAPGNLTDPLILPAGDLSGEVRTLSWSTSLTFKPVAPLGVTAKYRYYRYDDKSSSILFPGYVAFGESYWRTVRNDPSGPNDAPVLNEPFSYIRQTGVVSLDYHLSRPVTLLLEGGWEAWDYEELRIDKSNEYSLGAGILYRPSRSSLLKLVYTAADRDVDGYVPGNTAANPEAVGLENYNWADRERNKVEARYQVLLREAVTVGISAQYFEDDYGKESRFGLKESEGYSAGLDLAYAASDVVTLRANYGREQRRDLIQNGAKDDSFNVTASALDDPLTTDPFNPFNYWNSEIRDTVNSVGVGAEWQVVPGRLSMRLDYNFSLARMKFDNYNPFIAEAQTNLDQSAKLDNAIAQPWPDVITRYHEVAAELAYAVNRNLSVELRYLYEWFRLNDFAWNTMDNSLAGTTPENSTRYVFANATYTDFDAHVGSLHLRYTF